MAAAVGLEDACVLSSKEISAPRTGAYRGSYIPWYSKHGIRTACIEKRPAPAQNRSRPFLMERYVCRVSIVRSMVFSQQRVLLHQAILQYQPHALPILQNADIAGRIAVHQNDVGRHPLGKRADFRPTQ